MHHKRGKKQLIKKENAGDHEGSQAFYLVSCLIVYIFQIIIFFCLQKRTEFATNLCQ